LDDRPTFLLIGASNVTRGLGVLVEEVLARSQTPWRFVVAAGHGRALAVGSRFLFRGLPALEQCGAWDEISRCRLDSRSRLLVSDLGNDIVYGVAAGRVAEALDRLLGSVAQRFGAGLVLGLPLKTLSRFSERRLRWWKQVLFPLHRTPLSWILRESEKLDLLLRRWCEDRRLRYLVPRPEWYGRDPIHFQPARGFCSIAEEILGNQRPAAPVKWRPPLLIPWHCSTLGGWSRTRSQPGTRLEDGSTVSWY